MANAAVKTRPTQKQRQNHIWRSICKSKYMYLMLLPAVVYYIIFHYIPMFGAQIAFKNFVPALGITGSEWAGFKYFIQFFDSEYFWRLIKNTLGISLYDIIVGFPAPIILALMLNELKGRFFKKTVQTVVYLPHFISTVVIAGMVISFLSPRSGMVNNMLGLFGVEPIHFMAEQQWFKSIYVWSGVWQSAGWGSIIYMAALSGIDPSLYEAAVVDGASKFRRLWNITIPCIMPTIMIMLILRMGSVFTVGYEKVMLLYNPSIYETSDVISTYVYRRGIQGAEFSFSTAVGLFNSVINFAVIIIFNKISKKISEVSLW